jgi:hypothetical protein
VSFTQEDLVPEFHSGLLARRLALPAALVFVAASAAAQPPPQNPAAGAPAAVSGAPETTEQLRREVEQLRQEIASLQDAYAARLQALEAKIAALESTAAAAPAPANVPAPVQTAPGTTAQVPAGAAGGGGPEGALPVYGNAAGSSKVFNPDIAVIGNVIGAAGSNPIDPAPGIQLGEAETTFQAVVDPYARADFFFSFSPEGVEIEEGYLTLTSLPAGLLAKVGKFKEQVGKVNTLHPHTMPWVDKPLAVRNLLGGDEGLSDSGLSVSKLILNPLFFLEATGEIYQGSSSVFAAPTRSDVSWVGRLRGYRDLSESSNLDVGTSIAYGSNGTGDGLHTRIVALDATYRYRPLRRAIYRRFMGRSELFWSRREQPGAFASAFGFYASGDYQFARRWFAGARYDWSERAIDPSLVDKGPSLVLTYWPSEFSQIRGQYRRTAYAEGRTANELLFQFLFAIGAHGAHTF